MDPSTGELNQSAAPAPQSTAPMYVLAVICLLVGIAVGYLLHAPRPTVAAIADQTNQPAVPADAASAAMPSADQMNHMVTKAAEPILSALQKDPNNADLLAQAGTVYVRAQQFETAAGYYERALKIKPSAEGFIALSNTYHNAGADDRAIESLNGALKVDPKSATALFNLGMLEWKVKSDPDAAIAAWQRLLKSNPKHPRRTEVEGMIAKAKKHKTMASTEKIPAPPL